MNSWSYEALTPTSFLGRSAAVYADKTAVLDGERSWTYRELHQRCRALAAGLARLAAGRPIAILAPNSHVLLEAHYAVPWAGLPLVALNIRLSASELQWIVRHSGASFLVYDEGCADLAMAIRAEVNELQVISAGGPDDEYEQLMVNDFALPPVLTDEMGLLSVNYTSGTTGSPKGVMYHHRGAYLQSLAMVVHARLTSDDNYLWTLPMFHCNGWCFTWAVTAAGATHVCMRQVEGDAVWKMIREQEISALCGAPTVLSMIGYSREASVLPENRPLRVFTGGAPPTPAILGRMEELGAKVTHLYGLTETFGPIVVCDWRSEWDRLDAQTRAELGARQGVANVIATSIRVVDDEGRDVVADGVSTGEIVVRGNDVMLGYLHDDEATARAIPDGWFRTGDIGVLHPDGYMELRDRAKDVIISGGENISSVEVEAVLSQHPAVLECAVVAVPDEKWGEVPAAFVTLKEDQSATSEDLRSFVRDRLAHFKTPKYVTFGTLPKTSTGKVQKFALRDEAWAGRERRIG